MRGRDSGPFGIWWFGLAVLGILAVTTVALVTLMIVDQQVTAQTAAAEATRYTPPPYPTDSGQSAAPTVVFIGDSYTAGTGASSPQNRFVTLVATDEGWNVKNLAYGGTGYITTASNGIGACGQAHCPDYQQVISQAKAAKPAIIVVTGGRNDVGQSDTDLAAGITRFYQQLASALPKAKIYAVSPIWGADRIPSQLATIRDDVKSAAAASKAKWLDIGEPLQGHPDAVIADGVHPNDEGHRLIANAFEAALKG